MMAWVAGGNKANDVGGGGGHLGVCGPLKLTLQHCPF